MNAISNTKELNLLPDYLYYTYFLQSVHLFLPWAYEAFCKRGINFLDSGAERRGRELGEKKRTWLKPSKTRNSVRASSKRTVNPQPLYQTALKASGKKLVDTLYIMIYTNMYCNRNKLMFHCCC